METCFISTGTVAPVSKFKFQPCKCKNNRNVITETDRDDFIYDRCSVCKKIIEGSIRRWED